MRFNDVIQFLAPRFLKGITLVVAAAALAGCQPAATTTRPDDESGAIGFVKTLRQRSSTSLDALMVKINPTEQKETPTLRAWRGWWCPRIPGVRNADDVRREIAGYCANRGGVMDQDVACASKKNPGAVLFFAAITHTPHCTDTPTAEAYVVEPKPGYESSPDYISTLATFGYKPYLLRRMEAQADQMREAERMARVKREMPLLKTRGTRVCHEEGSFTYVGFVDDVSADGSKIRIEVKGLTTALRPSSWQPGPTWDRPENWYVCE